jgi:hypothetical protein
VTGAKTLAQLASGSGSGNVIGPASHAANYVPQWNSTPNSKTLVDGFLITALGKNLLDDATTAAMRSTLELASAALRNVEDTLTDGSNLPDGHAIKTYGDTNWGTGSSKWTDAGAYYKPNNWDYFRIQDSHILEIADSASFGSGFPWNDTVPYPGSAKGSMLSLGQTSSSDGNPPLWVQKKFNKSSAGNYHYAGAGHFEVWKQSGSTGSAVSALTGCIQQEASSGDAIAIHGRARKQASGNAYAGWFYAYRASGQSGGYCQGVEVNTSNRGADPGFSDTVGGSADIGLWLYSQDATYCSLAAIGIGADNINYSYHNGILFNTNAVKGTGVGINMTAIGPTYGIKFTEVGDSHLYCASGNLVFRDTVTGIKTLAELAAGGGGGINNVVEDTTPELGGNLYANNYEIVFNNSKALLFKNSSGSNRIGIRLDTGNNWTVGANGAHISLGQGSTESNAVYIHVNGVDDKQVKRSPDTDSQGRHYLTVT